MLPIVTIGGDKMKRHYPLLIATLVFCISQYLFKYVFFYKLTCLIGSIFDCPKPHFVTLDLILEAKHYMVEVIILLILFLLFIVSGMYFKKKNVGVFIAISVYLALALLFTFI